MNIFVSFVKEVQYFACLNLISKEDVLCLKEELYQLLTHMEALSITGEFSEGHKVFFYLSSIDFEATYTYIEKLIFKLVCYEFIQSILWTPKVRRFVKCNEIGFRH